MIFDFVSSTCQLKCEKIARKYLLADEMIYKLNFAKKLHNFVNLTVIDTSRFFGD